MPTVKNASVKEGFYIHPLLCRLMNVYHKYNPRKLYIISMNLYLLLFYIEYITSAHFFTHIYILFCRIQSALPCSPLAVGLLAQIIAHLYYTLYALYILYCVRMVYTILGTHCIYYTVYALYILYCVRMVYTILCTHCICFTVYALYILYCVRIVYTILCMHCIYYTVYALYMLYCVCIVYALLSMHCIYYTVYASICSTV